MFPARAFGDGREFGLARRCLDPEDVRASIPVPQRAVAGGVHPVAGEGIGTRDDDEIGVAARLHGRLDLADVLACLDHVLAGHVSAPLGRHLILEVDGRHAGLLVGVHGLDHVDGIAVARIRIGDHGNAHGIGDATGVVDHLRAGQERHVGAAEQRARRGVTTHVDDIEPGLFDEPRREGVVCAGSEQR